jgi:hypothetical protein
MIHLTPKVKIKFIAQANVELKQLNKRLYNGIRSLNQKKELERIGFVLAVATQNLAFTMTILFVTPVLLITKG